MCVHRTQSDQDELLLRTRGHVGQIGKLSTNDCQCTKMFWKCSGKLGVDPGSDQRGQPPMELVNRTTTFTPRLRFLVVQLRRQGVDVFVLFASIPANTFGQTSLHEMFGIEQRSLGRIEGWIIGTNLIWTWSTWDTKYEGESLVLGIYHICDCSDRCTTDYIAC